jgi:hypothetical protein
MSLSSCNSIKTFVFSTLYTTITNSKLKDWLKELVQQCFLKMNGQRRYKYLELRRDTSYFVKTTLIVPESSLKQISSKYSSCIDNIFFGVWWTRFSTDRHTYGYQKCAPLLADLLLIVRDRLHTGASQEKRKEASLILYFYVRLYR